MAADQRPFLSAMPEHLARVFDVVAPRAVELVEETFALVIQAGGADPPPGLDNDALSLTAQVVAHAAFAATLRLHTVRPFDLRIAAEIMSGEIARRFSTLIDLVEAQRDAPGATRQ